eukprot:Partr_v1_DN28001_c2_g2_i1_m57063 putative Allows the formation of correctly charged Gln-tRNA(Gln) through the transamidation of misacylated Glu-tRNA(Gln) in the mitochondria. The reaction takes place in the presence of glutamine and ATP through an activated gamma-phospho-Glu-tRNA(Gln) (By similarity)
MIIRRFLSTTPLRLKTNDIAIGLEIHAQLSSEYKLFSPSRVSSSLRDVPSNSNVCAFDLALPGSINKILNKHCLLLAIKASLALNCTIARTTSFDRKHYFYHDLPAGYQLTQKFYPVGFEGKVTLGHLDGCTREFKVGIEQVQLEQDSAKSIHASSHGPGNDIIQVDYNRVGIPLIEIVSKPDMTTAREAVAFVKHVHGVLSCLELSNAGMDDGSMRVDVNISIRDDDGQLGPRCELKNVAGLKQIMLGIEAEVERQRAIMASGAVVRSSTRTFDMASLTSIELRDKESALDYRYFPDPELPNIRI